MQTIFQKNLNEIDMDNLDLNRQRQEAPAKKIVVEALRAADAKVLFTGSIDADSSVKTTKRVGVVIDYAKGRIAVS